MGSGALAFTSVANTTFTPSVYGTFSVTATGSPTPYISLTSGTLPSGLTFIPGTGTGTLYGTPTVAGTYYLTFTASSTAGTLTQTLTLTVGSGSSQHLTFSVSSALGLTPVSGYSTTTPKYASVGKYVTWQFTGGSALAGQRVNVLVATRVGGVWGTPKYLKSAWANSSGIVTFARALSSAGAINVRIQWPGNTTYGVSTSKALGAYWK